MLGEHRLAQVGVSTQTESAGTTNVRAKSRAWVRTSTTRLKRQNGQLERKPHGTEETTYVRD